MCGHTFEALWETASRSKSRQDGQSFRRGLWSAVRPRRRSTLRGRVWQALGSYGPDPTLVADLKAALAAQPQSADLHNALGIVEAAAGRQGGRVTAPLAEQAAGHFLDALRADSRHLLAALNLAEALVAVEQTTRAAELARRALTLLDQEQAADQLIPDAGHFPPAQDLFRLEWERAAWNNAGQPRAEAEAKRAMLRWRLHALLGELTGDLVHYREAVLARPDLPTARAAGPRPGRGWPSRRGPAASAAGRGGQPCDADAARAWPRRSPQPGTGHGGKDWWPNAVC